MMSFRDKLDKKQRMRPREPLYIRMLRTIFSDTTDYRPCCDCLMGCDQSGIEVCIFYKPKDKNCELPDPLKPYGVPLGTKTVSYTHLTLPTN